MSNIIFPFSKQDEFENLAITLVGEDLALIQTEFLPSEFFNVFKPECTIAMICEHTQLCGSVGLTSFEISDPCLIILMPNQIVKFESISNSCKISFILMSKAFTDCLNIENRFSIFINIHHQPCVKLNQEELSALLNYYHMVEKTIFHKDPDTSIKIAKHLTKAFYYGLGYELHEQSKKIIHNKKDKIIENFIELVQKYYHEQRHLTFYAEKLGIRLKYLSKIIKDNSGLSASDWIDYYLIAESKILLKSTDMSIQQISLKMNFPSQTFYGKYFKRHTGMSPSQYRDHN